MSGQTDAMPTKRTPPTSKAKPRKAANKRSTASAAVLPDNVRQIDATRPRIAPAAPRRAQRAPARADPHPSASDQPAAPPARRMGRPTRLTPEVSDMICAALANCVPIKYAAEVAGVSLSTVMGWRARATKTLANIGLTTDDEFDADAVAQSIDPDEWPYLEFLYETRAAERRSVVTAVAKIRADPAWQATAWLLERRMPAEFGRRRLEITGADGGPIEMVDTSDVRRAVIDRIERLAAIDVESREEGVPPLTRSPSVS